MIFIQITIIDWACVYVNVSRPELVPVEKESEVVFRCVVNLLLFITGVKLNIEHANINCFYGFDIANKNQIMLRLISVNLCEFSK